MNRYVAPWVTPNGPSRILAVALLVGAIHWVSIVSFGTDALPYALVVPLAILRGRGAMWGVVVGGGVVDLLALGPGVGPLVTATAIFVAGVLALELWDTLPERGRDGVVNGVLAVVPITFVGTVYGIGVSIVGASLAGMYGAAAVVPTLFGERLVVALLTSAIVFVGGYRWIDSGTERPTTSLTRWFVILAGLGIIGFGWVLGTALFDLVRRDVQAIPALFDAIARPFPWYIQDVIALAIGPSGWIVYVLGALLALIMTVAVLQHAVPVREGGSNVERLAGR